LERGMSTSARKSLRNSPHQERNRPLIDAHCWANLPEWLTTKQAAVLLNRSPYTIRVWCEQRRLTRARKSNTRGREGEWLISREEVRQVFNNGGKAPALPPQQRYSNRPTRK
jgi:hypothetical protein